MDSRQLLAELPRLRRYARALTGERAAADDLVQDTLERAWQRKGQCQPQGNLRGWLLAIMHNLRMDELRRHGRADLSIDDADLDLPAPPAGDPLALRDVGTALARLPEGQRAVLLLVGLEELSYAEVAQALGIPQGTVMSRLARGRENLRRLLDGQGKPDPLRAVR